LDVRVVNEGEVLVEVGKAIPGLLVVGGGRILIYDANGEQTGELNMGDFVFSSELLGGAKAPGTAKAARGGALILAAPRQVAHELMMSVPPLVEVLAD
jgi:CRP-like cAMP-binding protein